MGIEHLIYSIFYFPATKIYLPNIVILLVDHNSLIKESRVTWEWVLFIKYFYHQPN